MILILNCAKYSDNNCAKSDMKENYGRLSLVKNDGKDILISGSNLSSAGFGATQFISQTSVSLRESKGIDANIADAMGFVLK